MKHWNKTMNFKKYMFGILGGCILAGSSMLVSADEQIMVDFERIYTENGQEYAIIQAMEPDGTIVWTYETGLYEMAQLNRVTDIGSNNDAYYFCEDGVIKALDLTYGSTLWENPEFGGSAIDSLFDDAGNIYVCGYFGPDLMALTPEGETAMFIDMASEDLYWPYLLEWYDDTTIEITYEGGGLDEEAHESLLIDVSGVREYAAISRGGFESAENIDDSTWEMADALDDAMYIADSPTYYVVNCRESITLRTSPSVYASEICQMPLGTAVSFLGYAENGFYYVQYNGMTGYALASYLSSEMSSGYSTYWVVNCKQSITLRKVPSVDGPEICQMPLGAAVTFISRADNGFYCVEYNGQTGYALASYLTADANYGGYYSSSVCQVVNCRQSITLRTSPSIYASEIMQLPLGVCVNYLGFAGNGFYQVEYNGRVGYALASYLMFL